MNPDTLSAELLPQILTQLERSVVDKKHPFRLAYLATTDSNGFPMVRMIVLRDFSASHRILTFFTHHESPKIQQIRHNPNTQVLFYHPKRQQQLRIQGTGKIHFEDAITAEYWPRVPDFRQFEYLGKAPGTVITDPDTITNPPLTPPLFCVIQVHFSHMDWLQLGRSGHSRVSFNYLETGNWEGTPINP